MSADPFNINPEVNSMRENIAERAFKIKLIGGLITTAFFLAAMLMPQLGLLLLAAGGISTLVTYKAAKRLEIDQQFLESRMQGRNWWNGYKNEIGTQPPSLDIAAPNLPGNVGNSRVRGAE